MEVLESLFLLSCKASKKKYGNAINFQAGWNLKSTILEADLFEHFE